MSFNHFGCNATSTHACQYACGYIRGSTNVCALILHVNNEIAVNWSVKETRGSCQHWRPKISNTDLDALSYDSQVCDCHVMFIGRALDLVTVKRRCECNQAHLRF